MNGILVSDEVIMILGMRTRLPTLDPVMILASTTNFPVRIIISLVPLQRPCEGLMFRRSMTGIPVFNLSSCRGKPCSCRLFKYSIGYAVNCSSLSIDDAQTSSQLLYTLYSPDGQVDVLLLDTSHECQIQVFSMLPLMQINIYNQVLHHSTLMWASNIISSPGL